MRQIKLRVSIGALYRDARLRRGIDEQRRVKGFVAAETGERVEERAN